MKRYVIVGTGSRVYSMFVEGLRDRLGVDVEITGAYDVNRTRAEFYKKSALPELRIYDSFDEMVEKEKPDAVIVGTVDSTHAQYVVRAMELGCDVISEKPLVNRYEDAVAVREAERRTGKKVTVTFNCRFMPVFTAVKELVKEGRIGKVHSVVYDYSLNRWHGGDYFKRWHRMMKNSEGMLLHKSTHHFDIVNWLLDDEPMTVSALARRSYYGDEAKSYASRCSECPRTAECESYKSQSARLDQALYFEAEHEDGYIRDKCAFLPDTDIYDNMSVSVMYKQGTILSYALNLFSMREGYRMTLTGERGVILVSCYSTDEGQECSIKLMNAENQYEDIPFASTAGAHGGGDKRLLDMIFGDVVVEDPLGRFADSFAGITSAMIGIAANESIKKGIVVPVTERLDPLR